MTQPDPPPRTQEPVSELVLSLAEAAEPIPLTIPLDRPEPMQYQQITDLPGHNNGKK